MLKLHVVQAEYGDCLILEYGQQASPRYILIDGGPTTTYERHLQGLLQQREEGGGARGHVRPVDGWGGTSRQGLGLAVECVELGAISLRVGLLLRIVAVVAQPGFQLAAIVRAETGITRAEMQLACRHLHPLARAGPGLGDAVR